MMEILFSIINTLSIFTLQSYRSTFSGIGILLILIQLEINLITNFMAFVEVSTAFDDVVGELFSLMILVLGAVEAALGLSLLVGFYRLSSHLSINL
jgi:NADH:ubiquinone oxidoreductase subunit K